MASGGLGALQRFFRHAAARFVEPVSDRTRRISRVYFVLIAGADDDGPGTDDTVASDLRHDDTSVAQPAPVADGNFLEDAALIADGNIRVVTVVDIASADDVDIAAYEHLVADAAGAHIAECADVDLLADLGIPLGEDGSELDDHILSAARQDGDVVRAP